MKLTIKQLKQLIKEQVEESWFSKKKMPGRDANDPTLRSPVGERVEELYRELDKLASVYSYAEMKTAFERLESDHPDYD